MNVPFFRPSIGESEKSAVNSVLQSGWLTTGQAVRRFETAFAAYLNVRHAVALNSCTAALHLALETIGLKRDDAVLVPTMTFAATAEVVRYFGARPILVDCEPATLLIDPGALEAAILRWSSKVNIRAVIPMHYGGQMADMHRIAELSRKYSIQVIEDSAHALPAQIRRSAAHAWETVGSTSPLTCFSFYANKCITTGEGGMVVTNDAAAAERIRMMSLHGLSKDAWNRFDTEGYWYYEIVEAGFKYNMTDVAAAIGLAQLEKVDHFWQQRRRVARQYSERLAGCAEWIEPYAELVNRQSSWHLYPIRLRLDRLGIDRAQFIDGLKQRGVTCSVHWMPLHLHPYYRRAYGIRPEDFPVASSEWPRLISLPIFPGMTDEEIEHVCAAVTSIARKNALAGAVAAFV